MTLQHNADGVATDCHHNCVSTVRKADPPSLPLQVLLKDRALVKLPPPSVDMESRDPRSPPPRPRKPLLLSLSCHGSMRSGGGDRCPGCRAGIRITSKVSYHGACASPQTEHTTLQADTLAHVHDESNQQQSQMPRATCADGRYKRSACVH